VKDTLASRLSKARTDLRNGFLKPSLWWALAWLDIKQRYRRSLIGPFWITASTAIMVSAMGPLYGTLLSQNFAAYLPYLAVSLILWSFISTPLNEAGSVFVGAEPYIRQVPLPLSVYIFRLLARNFLILLHNSAIILVVLLLFPPEHLDHLWLAPLGLCLVLGNLFWITLLLALGGSRFRDIPQLTSNIVQLTFFITPILWKSDMLGGRHRFLADFNPIFHFIEVIRAPLLGTPIRPESWLVAAGLLVVGSTMAILVFARLRARVPYWL
jgi:lipopolysaccharide transport system permease protein